MKEPMLSVILPVYNSERYIEKTLQSILNQTYENFEVLIIDDCPTDNTMSIIENIADKRIRILHNKKNRGIAFSRNLGLVNSRAKYIALIDHDDVAMEERFEKQIEFLENNPQIDVVGGRIRLINEHDEFISDIWGVSKSPNVLKALLLFVNPYSNSEVTFRREFVIKNNIKYEDHMYGLEDFKFWIQCSKKGKLSNIDELVLYRRIMESSETGKVRKENLDKRLQLYGKLQEYSLELSGFKLNTDQLALIHKIISDGSGMCETGKEFKDYYRCLCEIVKQGRRMQVDYLDGLIEVTWNYLLNKSRDMDAAKFWI